jgi:hypothetical protein
MRLKQYLWMGLVVALGAPAPADELVQASLRYTFNPEHGNLAGAAAGDDPFMVESFDHYRLWTPEGVTEAGEADDVVIKREVAEDGSRVLFGCRNETLRLDLLKEYRIDPDHGWLVKKIAIRADPEVGGELWFESGVEVPPPWWNGGMLWEPVWHTGINPFTPAREIKEYANLAPKNGCRAFVALYQPRRDACVIHFRWGGEVFEHFDVVGERDDFGKRVWPRRWRMGSQERFVGGPHRRTLTIQMVYGLHEGTAQHVLMTYAALPEFRELFIDPLDGAPAWMSDTIVDEHWDSSYLNHGYDELLKDVVEKKLHFGNITTVLWGAFPHELYIAKPEDTEPGSPDDPAANIEMIRRMQGLSPRIKAGYYTHFGSVSVKRGSRMARLAEEKGWKSYRRDGTESTHRTDYDMEDNRAAVDITRYEPGYRQLLHQRFRDLFELNGVDLIYMDTAVRPGNYEYDWKEFRAPTARDIIELYAGFQEIAHEFGGTTTMNMPIPTCSQAGFAEFPWISFYQDDWRRFSGRIALCQAMNPADRRLFLAGQIMPSGDPAEPSIRIHLNSMRLLAMGLGMLDVKQVQQKRELYVRGAPYIQAAYELRSRALVNAGISPDWFKAHETEIEAYAWRMTGGYGLVTAMNHDIDPVAQTIAFDTKPLGLRPGRPAFVWRYEMPDPRQIDYAGVTMESPIRQLAVQKLIRVENSLPRRVSLDLALPGDNPVEIVVTHSPAVITSVDGKPCQYGLPEAYGVKANGVIGTGQVNVTVENPAAHAGIRIALSGDFGETPHVRQRKWSDSHSAGVAVGFEAIEHTVQTIDGQTFVNCEVGKGQTEIVVNP